MLDNKRESSPDGLAVKNLHAIQRSGLGKTPWGGHGNSLQFPCLENPMGKKDGWLQFTGSQSDMTQATGHIHAHNKIEAKITRKSFWENLKLEKCKWYKSLPPSPSCCWRNRDNIHLIPKGDNYEMKATC